MKKALSLLLALCLLLYIANNDTNCAGMYARFIENGRIFRAGGAAAINNHASLNPFAAAGEAAGQDQAA